MFFEKLKVLGIMSGTSLDGVDFAVVDFEWIQDRWEFKIVHSQTIAYNESWFAKLKYAAQMDLKDLEKLNIEYTDYLNQLIHTYIKQHEISGLNAISSHGHTILHNPKAGYTLQIGNLPEIKKDFNIPIVCDFRVQDVDFGGQGAPLVPIGDRLLFSDYDFCLNLGGFSNISFEDFNQRIAYDICPINTVMNYYANKLGLPYDDQGKLAASGTIHSELLTILNSNPYFEMSFPKSLGIEFVFEQVLPLIDSFNLSVSDVLATYVQHIVDVMYKVLYIKEGRMLVTGGGAFNTYLISKVRLALPNLEIVIPEADVINYKEALIFAFLGVLRLNNSINVLSSVTGARQDHSSGIVF